MANVISAFVRFYPIKGKLNRQHFESCYNKLNKQLWSSYYFFNLNENCVELLYPCKSPVRKDLYENDEILSNYHIWIRVADYACYEDQLGFKSTKYLMPNSIVDEKSKYECGFDNNWNLATSCLYSADELSLVFNTTETNFFERLIRFDSYKTIPVKLDDNKTWTYKLMITYLKSSQIHFENDYTGIHKEIDFYRNNFGLSDSHIWDIMVNQRKINLKENVIDKLFVLNEKNEQIKFDQSIEEIIFKRNNEQIHSIKWINKNEGIDEYGWVQKTSSNWDNIINSEYIEFINWYKINN